jgi:hypothetical protein
MPGPSFPRYHTAVDQMSQHPWEKYFAAFPTLL